jgi:ATP-dependent DNA helicase RecG
MVKFSTPLLEVKGVGPGILNRLKKFNFQTVEDLLKHFPSRYEDFSQIVKIADLKINETATIQGVISDIKLKRTWKRRMFIVEALISDDTGSIKAIWFNQRFLIMALKKGKLVNLAGKVVSDPKGGLCLSHPMHEIINQQIADSDEQLTKHTGRLVPVYPETRGLTSKTLRFLIKPILDNLEKIKDPIPKEILTRNNLPDANEAIQKIHFPENLKEAKIAKKRFAFEDLFLLQLANIIQRAKLAGQKSYIFETDIDYVKNLLGKLPFELTTAQKKSLWEILKDLNKPRPMNRLLQGDVGSGKTIVATLVALIIAKQNKQSAFMAPTEVLARQHYSTFKKFFSDFDKGVALLTSAEARVFYGDGLESEFKKPELVKKIEKGEIKIIFGTHALIQKYVKFKELAFVVIDEQHRFGVRQRAELLKNHKAEIKIPHLLSMSATPIPRTLTLTIFGDLDLSIIDELPKNRKEIITKIVAPANRDKAYAFIRGQVKKGRQVFVICPRIDPADMKTNIFALDVRAVKEEYEKLAKNIFPDLKVAMLHGKMPAKPSKKKPDEKSKAEIMEDFKENKIDILVSTSVVEVGVDIPNATIMMIEGSERFGLAQLYQFRGRVGRGEHQSFCFLFSDSTSRTTYKRLHSLIEAKNGFELAEKDLEIRGPGEILGDSQTGLPDLAMKALQNPEFIKSARKEAENLLKKDPELIKYPLLKTRLESFIKEIHLE